MKTFIGVDPGSKEEDFTRLSMVKNGEIIAVYITQSNEIKMLRLFNLLCGGKGHIGEKILITHLDISEGDAKAAIVSLVRQGKLKREFTHSTWSISRGDKLFD